MPPLNPNTSSILYERDRILMAGGMGRPGQTGIPLGQRLRASTQAGADEPSDASSAGRHVWVTDAPGQPGRWPGVLVEWRRTADGWTGRVAYVLPELNGLGTRLVERWLPAGCLSAVEV